MTRSPLNQMPTSETSKSIPGGNQQDAQGPTAQICRAGVMIDGRRGGRSCFLCETQAGTCLRPTGGGEIATAKHKAVSAGLAVAVAAICPRRLFSMGSVAARSSFPIMPLRSIAVWLYKVPCSSRRSTLMSRSSSMPVRVISVFKI
jgi:hypothetical protein